MVERLNLNNLLFGRQDINRPLIITDAQKVKNFNLLNIIIGLDVT